MLSFEKAEETLRKENAYLDRDGGSDIVSILDPTTHRQVRTNNILIRLIDTVQVLDHQITELRERIKTLEDQSKAGVNRKDGM